MSAIALRVQAVGKRYRLGARQRYRTLRDTLAEAMRGPWRRRPGVPGATDFIWALQDVSFELERGQVLGVVGPNGSGKSTLLKILSRITEPTTGRVEVDGRVGSLLEVGTGFHDELTGRENIHLSGAILGMRRQEVARKFDEIVAFAEVERFLDTPVKHYSTGMYLRLGFAVAAHLEPEVLLVDEVLAVGDAAFQRKCLGKMDDVARGGRTVLLVSHNVAAIRNLCHRALVLRGGRLAFDGSSAQALDAYLNSSAPHAQGRADLRRHPGRPPGMTPVIQALLVCGPDGHGSRETLRTGEDAVFALEYDTGDLAIDYVMLGIVSPLGDRICSVGTHLTPGFRDVLRGRGGLECRLRQLPLAPGEYSVLVAAGTRMPTRNVDYVEDALRFRVEVDDFFGTGQTLRPGQGYLAQHSEWRLLPASQPAAALLGVPAHDAPRPDPS
jgi:lipopolysaccharide transport system ATP-binding protein